MTVLIILIILLGFIIAYQLGFAAGKIERASIEMDKDADAKYIAQWGKERNQDGTN